MDLVNVKDEVHLKSDNLLKPYDLNQSGTTLCKDKSESSSIHENDVISEKSNYYSTKSSKKSKISFFEKIGLKKHKDQADIQSPFIDDIVNDDHEEEEVEEEEEEEDDDDDELSIISSPSSEEQHPIPHISISSPTTLKNLNYVKTKTKSKRFQQEFSRLLLAQTISTSFRPDPNNDSKVSSDTSAEPNSNHPYGALWTLRFSKDGKFLASAGQNCVVHLWKLIDPQQNSIKVLEESPYKEYTGHTADILDLAWSKNNFLLSSSMDHTVRLWHPSQNDCLCVFQHLNIVTSVLFHPKDDRFFLSSSMDSRIRIWSIPEKRVAFWNEIPGGKYATAAAFTLDGKTVIVGSHDGHCYFFETQSLKYITQISVTNDTHRSSSKKGPKVTGIEVMPGMPPGDEKILISSNDSKVRLYNIKDKSLMFKYKGAVNTALQIKASFSDDGRYIISGSEDCHTYIWTTEQSTVSPFYHLNEARNIALSAFGHTSEQPNLIESHSSSSLSQFQSQPNSPQQHHRGPKWFKRKENHTSDKVRSRIEYFEAHDYVVTAAIFAPTKTRQCIAKTKQDTIYNNTPVSMRRLSAVSNTSQSSFSQLEDDTFADGHIIITSDFRGTIKVWRVDSSNKPMSIDTQSLSHLNSDLSSPASINSSTSTLGGPAKSVMTPSPKTRRNFGLFHSRYSK